MRLAPGPIPEITSSWYDDTPIQPGFAQLASDELEQLPQYEGIMDSFLDPDALVLSELPDDGTDADLQTAQLKLNEMASFDVQSDSDAVDAAQQTASEAVLNVYTTIPAEAFEVAPGPATYVTTPEGTPILGASGVQLLNLTRPGATDYRAGESYEFVFIAPPPPGNIGVYAGVAITIYKWFNDVQYGSAPLGVTDSQGYARFQSIWGVNEVGNWKATFGGVAADGTIIDAPDFFWTVLSAAGATTAQPNPTQPTVDPSTGLINFGPGGPPAPPPQTKTPTTPTAPVLSGSPGRQPVTVTFTNTTSGNASQLRIGDHWTLQITGPPNALVVVAGNGPPGVLAPFDLGYTDAAGNFVYTGIADASSIGAWEETYKVGAAVWPKTLNFTVL